MRLAFFGTPATAARYLKHLAPKHDIVAVVTQCDRPRGRSGAPEPPAVKRVAEELCLPVLQPERGACGEACERLHEARPDVCVVVAFGQIIPCDFPDDRDPMRFINVHYSLLPKLRGAAPVQHAILQGLPETGVTVQELAQELDAGNVILQRSTAIDPEDTSASLMSRLTEIGLSALDDALELIESGNAPSVPQDESQATWAPCIRKSDGLIDWREPAEQIEREVRAYYPWPSAYTSYRGRLLRILKARPIESRACNEGIAGAVVEIHAGESFTVACGSGALVVTQVQGAGRASMSAAEWLNGARLEIGAQFG